MGRTAAFVNRYRVVMLALAASAALHAAVFVGVPGRSEGPGDEEAAVYSASLEPGAAPAPSPAPAHKPGRRTRPLPRVDAAPLETPSDLEPLPEVIAAAAIAPMRDVAPADVKPRAVALATPASRVTAPEAPKFPVAALPAGVSITYSLDSAFAKGRAVYEWTRDGDSYRITGEGEAVGFFALFLEGRIVQESRGTVTAEGLRPERFVEHRPGAAEEGVEFDWRGHRVTFERGDSRKSAELADNTVDWLSMIFQMAHMPPSGESYDLKASRTTSRCTPSGASTTSSSRCWASRRSRSRSAT